MLCAQEVRNVQGDSWSRWGSGELSLEAFHVNEEDGSDKEGEELAENQPTDNSQPKGLTSFTARAVTERNGQRSHQGSHGGHHNRPKTDEAGFIDSLAG